jgi:hypothetical protein
MQKLIIVLLVLFLETTPDLFADMGVGESPSGFLTSLTPVAIKLNSPNNEAINLPDTITVMWSSQIYSATYNLQVSKTTIFKDCIVNETSLKDTSYTITGLSGNTVYFWRVRAENVAGLGDFSTIWHFTTSDLTGIDQKFILIPEHHSLLPVYPNPFNPVTTISYHLSEKTEVSLIIYNNLGQSVKCLVSDYQQPGIYTMQWDAKDSQGKVVTNGMYICIMKAGTHTFTQKMLLIR